jgi:hypothetical protein
MTCLAEVYQPSTRTYKGLPDFDYPFHDKIIVVTNCGRICLGHKKIDFSTVFAGQAVGLKEVRDDIWLLVLWISILTLTSLNRSSTRSPEVVTYVASTFCNPCLRLATENVGAESGS